MQALEERNQKLKQEKETTTKSLKSMKTKLERASQMEEVGDWIILTNLIDLAS